MKKSLVLPGILAVSVLSFSCSSKKETVSMNLQNSYQDSYKSSVDEGSKYSKELAKAPRWVLDPSSVSKFAAVGSAKIGAAGFNFARTEALANARDELARQIQLKVKNFVRTSVETTGVGDSETVDRVVGTASKQVTRQVLIGSRQKAMWISPNDELFVLVELDEKYVKDLGKYLKEAIITSYKNDRALWQKFQSKKLMEELEEEIKKEFSY